MAYDLASILDKVAVLFGGFIGLYIIFLISSLYNHFMERKTLKEILKELQRINNHIRGGDDDELEKRIL